MTENPLSALTTWLLGFVLVVYLGLRGGGFDPIVIDAVGIAMWWILIAGLLIGIFPVRNLSRATWVAAGLLAGFAVWTGLSLLWTDSSEKTASEFARNASYLGVFAVALLSRGRKSIRMIVSSVAAAVVTIAAVALVSRLHPSIFADAAETGKVLTSEAGRLSFPIGYWNGLAALIAMALPLIVHTAGATRNVIARSLAAAAIPLLVLTLYFTLSRAGVAAALIGLAVYFAFASDRLPKALPLLTGGVGGALLIWASTSRQDLDGGLNTDLAGTQGDELTVLLLVVCVAVGVAQFLFSSKVDRGSGPSRLAPSRRAAAIALAVVSVVGLIAFVAVDGPGRTSDAWSEFKSIESPDQGSGRLQTSAGNGRYQYWASSINQFEESPLAGQGSGTFEYWWAANGNRDGFVRDTHSLYFQTLGELGVIGLALLGGFLVALFTIGVRTVIRTATGSRSQVAATLAGCSAFVFVAAFDWVWQIPAIVVPFLLLAAALLSSQSRSYSRRGNKVPVAGRVLATVFSLGAIVAISIPMTSTILVRESQTKAEQGQLDSALTLAGRAAAIQPGASSPLLQQALLLESSGNRDQAVTQATKATEVDPANWRPWLVLSGIEARAGQAESALENFRTARSLNPRSLIFRTDK